MDDEEVTAKEEQSNEPVIVIEEEVDPEKVLEERRRKREEIMARFAAQKAAGTGQQPVQAAGMAKEQLLGTGADSVTSAGTRTGLTTSGECLLLPFAGRESAGDGQVPRPPSELSALAQRPS